MKHTYEPSGVCSHLIEFELADGDIVKDVKFSGGCDGNSKGIAKLVEGMPAEKVVSLLSGISCGRRPTSCPDQLAIAVAKARDKDKEQQ